MNFMEWATGQQYFLSLLIGGGGGGGVRGRMKRGKLGSLGHYDPIFKYPDVIL